MQSGKFFAAILANVKVQYSPLHTFRSVQRSVDFLFPTVLSGPPMKFDNIKAENNIVQALWTEVNSKNWTNIAVYKYTVLV